jgi:glycosyltransferase involved in cell wall biosynthesis
MDLAEILPMLVAQVNAVRKGVSADVLVIDNDAEASAAEIAADLDPNIVRYVVEPRAGIAAARNRALDESESRDVLVFIDDDERPSEAWLARLLETWRAHDVAAVTGPVISIVDGPVDPWLAAGGIFDRLHRSTTPTGADVASAATNNLLLDLNRVRRHGLRFADDLGLSGGEDTLFTRRLVAKGERIVWCGEAAVVEKVRPERVSRRWMLMRAFSYGTIDCRVARELAPDVAGRLMARLRCLGNGIARIGYGAARAGLGLVTASKRRQALGAQTSMRGVGLVLGALGYTHQRYRARRG